MSLSGGGDTASAIVYEASPVQDAPAVGAEAQSVSDDVGVPVDQDVVREIQRLYEQARSRGLRPPGRPALVEATGATDHKVRTAMTFLRLTGALKPAASSNGGGGDAGDRTAPASAESSGDRPAAGDARAVADDVGGVELVGAGRPGAGGTGDSVGDSAGDGNVRPALDSAVAAGSGGVAAGAFVMPPAAGSAGAASRAEVQATPVVERPAAGDSVQRPESGRGAKAVSWAGFVFGTFMSVAANVLHTWLPAAGNGPEWTPSVAAQVGAGVWPLGLLLSVEILSRVRWRSGILWQVARFGGTGVVALGAAAISYGHVRDVLLAWGYGALSAHVGPLVLDGLMVVSGFALLAMGGPAGDSGAGGVDTRAGGSRARTIGDRSETG